MAKYRIKSYNAKRHFIQRKVLFFGWYDAHSIPHDTRDKALRTLANYIKYTQGYPKVTREFTEEELYEYATTCQ